VTDKILEVGTPKDSDSPEMRIQKQLQIDAVLKLIPRLQYGLDVNVKFDGKEKMIFL